MLAVISIVIAAIAAAATVTGVILTYRRYRREVPRKALSYYAVPLNESRKAFKIQVSNSGNQAIEQGDWITREAGFNFKTNTPISDVRVDEQIPEDLGIEERKIEISDSGKIQLPLPLIYFNPGDYFSVITFFDHRVETNPEPYGRVRQIHDLFHEVEAPAIGQTPQPSAQTYIGFVVSFIGVVITIFIFYFIVRAYTLFP